MRKTATSLLVLATAVAAMMVAGPAAATSSDTGHTVTETDNFHGTQTTTDVNPCTNNTIDLSQISNIVNHITYFPAGDEVWGTFTEEDKVTGLDEGTGVLYTGHSTFWGNFNINERNANDTFTGSIHVTGSDGTSISYHEVMHETWNANGILTVSFDKPSLTCGG
jgi:hypothetical protein